MKIEQFLQTLGLKSNESKIYQCLLESGALTVAAISKQIGLHRQVIYKSLPDLIAKQLISQSLRGKQKLFVAESPQVLKKSVVEFSNSANETLDELQNLFETSGRRPKVKYLEGTNGIASVLMDIVNSLNKGDIYYRYSSEKGIEKSKKITPKAYYDIQAKKQLERFVISNAVSESQRNKVLDRIVKIVPTDAGLFEHNIVHVIYGNKVAYIDYETDTVFVIEDQRMADFSQKIFMTLYKKL